MSNPEPLWKQMYLAASNAPQGRDDWSHCVRNAAAAEIRAVAKGLKNKQSGLLTVGHELTLDEAVRWLGYEADRAEESNG